MPTTTAVLNHLPESTIDALDDVRLGRGRQKEIGTDGELVARNDLLATIMAYMGRAASGVRRNANLDPHDMLVKAAAVAVDVIERTDGRSTNQAMDAVRNERVYQIEQGYDEAGFDDVNNLIVTANAYFGRAGRDVWRNEREDHDPFVMLVKGAATLVAAIERA